VRVISLRRVRTIVQEKAVPSDRRKIFVLGTGRSGTCWLGDVLGQHPAIHSYVETRPLFDWVTQAAVNTRIEQELLPRIFDEYDRLFHDASPLHMADKSHPCIWIAERLAERFPDAYFIGVTRDVEPTVASMLKHAGVRRWCEEWYQYEVPNRFLGITERNFDWYRGATILERCVARWCAHQSELNRLQHALTTRFLLVKYETLVTDTRAALANLQEFLSLNRNFPAITPQTCSLTKWKAELTSKDVAAIQVAISDLSQSYNSAVNLAH
jgi:hypothetical protein